jgi:hypothetical protein
MKVKQLIKQLQKMDPDMDVFVIEPEDGHSYSVYEVKVGHVIHGLAYNNLDFLKDEDYKNYFEDTFGRVTTKTKKPVVLIEGNY